MNIAHILPASAKFPLTKHNGRYEWALRLASLQADVGHQVTVYSAAGSSSDNPRLQWRGIERGSSSADEHNRALFRLALHDTQHDIFHSHLDHLHYTIAAETTKPIVFTQHWFPNKDISEAARASQSRNVTAVPVTNYMRQADVELGITAAATIYHGIDLKRFQPTSAPRSDRLMFIGRIAPHKGVREIVDLVLGAGEQLDIVGKVNAADAAYWDTILPLVDGERIRYLGSVPQTEVPQLLGTAKAFVFAPQILEAFGQVTIEAQACGAPVILSDSGAAHELVQDGKTGFVFSTPAEFNAAVSQIATLSSADCRTFAERFDIQTMAKAYEHLYEQLLVTN